MRPRLIALVLIVILTQGCGGGWFARQAPPVGPTPRESLLAADRGYNQFCSENGLLAAYDRMMADAGLQLPDGAEPLYGKTSILDEIRKIDGGVKLCWDPVDGAVAASGELGWTWGTFTMSWEEDARLRTSRGKYLNVWVKDSDGQWKIKVDIGNSSPAR